MCGCFHDNLKDCIQKREDFVADLWQKWIPDARERIKKLKEKGKVTGIMK